MRHFNANSKLFLIFLIPLQPSNLFAQKVALIADTLRLLSAKLNERSLISNLRKTFGFISKKIDFSSFTNKKIQMKPIFSNPLPTTEEACCQFAVRTRKITCKVKSDFGSQTIDLLKN